MALKLCKGEEDRFNLENKILYKLYPHDNIVAPKSRVSRRLKEIFYTLELLDGNMNELVVNTNLLNDRLLKIRFFLEICKGLEHAHKTGGGIIHRDLWWNNILYKKHDTSITAKVTDFGWAKDFEETKLSDGNLQKWGANYIIPPEHRFNVMNEHVVAYKRADIYALGILLHFLFHAEPRLFYFALDASIKNFQVNHSIQDFLSLSKSQCIDYYSKWLLSAQQHNILRHIEISTIDGTFNNKINGIVKKLCHLSYNKRYQSVSALIKDIEKIKNDDI